jgi:hypothetical protein
MDGKYNLAKRLIDEYSSPLCSHDTTQQQIYTIMHRQSVVSPHSKEITFPCIKQSHNITPSKKKHKNILDYGLIVSGTESPIHMPAHKGPRKIVSISQKYNYSLPINSTPKSNTQPHKLEIPEIKPILEKTITPRVPIIHIKIDALSPNIIKPTLNKRSGSFSTRHKRLSDCSIPSQPSRKYKERVVSVASIENIKAPELCICKSKIVSQIDRINKAVTECTKDKSSSPVSPWANDSHTSIDIE